MTVKKKVPAKKKAAPKKGKLGTGKQSAADRKAVFIEAYIANGRNATQAAITAGFSEKTARSQGQRLLTDVDVAEAVRERQGELAEKFELTTESVIAELSKIVHADPRKLFDGNGSLLPIDQLPDSMAGAIASIEVDELFEGYGEERKSIGLTKKVKFWDKNSAIDKAMKHLGLFEKDNKQKNLLDDLPREMVQAIAARLAGQK